MQQKHVNHLFEISWYCVPQKKTAGSLKHKILTFYIQNCYLTALSQTCHMEHSGLSTVA